jgi:hypothetical protein
MDSAAIPPDHAVSGQPPARRDALSRLTPLGWRGGMLGILAALAASFVLLGYFAIYWRTADMDFMVVYNALALNDGRPQHFFDHPAYFTILSVELWFKLLHGVGLLDAYSLSAMSKATDPAGFDAAMTQAVRAGRVVAWLTASAIVVVFAGLLRAIVRDWRIALLGAFALAFSGGVTLHLRILRSEMLAASFVVFALMIGVVVARRANVWRPLALGFAALLCLLGLENKVHAVLVIAALPVLVLPFGTANAASVPFWRGAPWCWVAAAALAAVAGVLLWLTWPLLATGLDRATAEQTGLRPLLAGLFGTYQLAIVLLAAACMVAFAAIWKVSVAETLAAMFAVVAGAALGLAALNLEYNVNNVVAIINPIEKMLTYAGLPATDGGGGLGTMLGALASNVGGMLKRYSYFLRTSARPAVFLIWLIVPGIVYAWRIGRRQTAIQALLLLLAAFGIDVLGNQRGLGLPLPYLVFTDPLIIIAGALLLDAMPGLRFARWAYPIGATLLVVHVAFSVAEPAKRMLSSGGPEGVCEWNEAYLPLLPLPWCGSGAKGG